MPKRIRKLKVRKVGSVVSLSLMLSLLLIFAPPAQAVATSIQLLGVA